eukprot:39896-Prorocentrum_minimum.AAC.1
MSSLHPLLRVFDVVVTPPPARFVYYRSDGNPVGRQTDQSDAGSRVYFTTDPSDAGCTGKIIILHLYFILRVLVCQ